jgi:hypothetical protein
MRKKAIIAVALATALALGSFGSALAAEDQLLCRVDIGDPASEAGHNVGNWGPIEPGTWWSSDPADWGTDVINARVVWDPETETECATLTLDHHLIGGAEADATTISFRFLDGMNTDGYTAVESFDLFVRTPGDAWGTAVFSYTDDGSEPGWVEVIGLDITGAISDPGANVEVKVCATGGIKWHHFYSHWGQVAFDWIELRGDTPENGGGEGLTPGYWKNHTEDWAAAGYSTGDMFGAIFTEAVGSAVWPESGDITLLAAVRMKGNSVNSLIRHAAAALLNAGHPDVDYDMSTAAIIALVNDAFANATSKKDSILTDAKNALLTLNEQGGSIP